MISLHCPLTEETRHLVGWDALAKMKNGVVIINTSRGALVDAEAAIDGILMGKIGSLGLDVYEEEEGVFYENLSNQIIEDEILARLLGFPNVLVSSHQAFFTQEAMTNIAATTIQNLTDFESSGHCPNEVALA